MTTLSGDTGKIAYGPLKTFNISLASPINETLQGTPITLGTSEPASGGTGVTSYTIQSSDLPTITPAPYSIKYCAYVVVSGRNTSGASVSVNYSIYKTPSGGTQAQVVAPTVQTVANNLYWTETHYRFYDVQVGDILEVRNWASVASGVTLDYCALVIYPTRIEITKSTMVRDLNYTMNSGAVLTLGTPNPAVGANWNVYLVNNQSLSQVGNSVDMKFTVASINLSANGFSGRQANGDATLSTGPQTHATNHPYYYKGAFPSKITFRELLKGN